MFLTNPRLKQRHARTAYPISFPGSAALHYDASCARTRSTLEGSTPSVIAHLPMLKQRQLCSFAALQAERDVIHGGP